MIEQTWYVESNGKAAGPYSADDVRSFLAQGRISAETLVCPVGGEKWMPLRLAPSLYVLSDTLATGEDEPEAPPPLPKPRLRKFARLELLAKLYDFFAWVTLGLGVIGAAGGIWLADEYFAVTGSHAVVVFALMYGLYLMFVAGISWITQRAVAELIRMGVHTENNTHATAQYCRQIAELLDAQRR